MIEHAMKYASMAQIMRAQLGARAAPWELITEFEDVERELVDAEKRLVDAYRHLRIALRAAAPYDALADRYLEETTWDLT